MVSLGGDKARMVIEVMEEVRAGQQLGRKWLDQLGQAAFEPVLSSCGRWHEGRHVPLDPQGFVYALINAWQDSGTLQVPPEQLALQHHLQRAFQRLDDLPAVLDRQTRELEAQLPQTIKREVLSWLPEPVDVDQQIEIVLGAPVLGFASRGTIYLDLLALWELGQERAEQFIAHHLFHFAHRKLADDSQRDNLWACLFSLQTEGIVNYVIGGSREMLELRYKYAVDPLRSRLRQRLEHYAAFARDSRPYFQELYDLLDKALDGNPRELVKYCRQTDPGHFQGVAMSKAIEDQAGAEGLKKTLWHPVEFLLAWHRTDGGGHLPMPDDLADKIKTLTEKYPGRPGREDG